MARILVCLLCSGLSLSCVVLMPGCGSADSARTTSDSQNISTGSTASDASTQIALNWYPEVEHGGFIAAKELGLFSASGLTVEIIPGSQGAPQAVIAELAAERIQFAISDADNVVKARSKGVPLVALMAPLQNSPRCIMVHAASGIEKLDDLANVELAISDTRPFALWMKKKLPLTNVRFVPFNGLVGEFLTKPDFAQQGFVFSEPIVAREKGGDPRVLMVSETGFNPYASLLVTTETVIQQDPKLVTRVVAASVQGWQQYLAKSAPINAAIHSMNDELSVEALEAGTAAMKPLCDPPDGQAFGNMASERWKALVSQIEELQEIEPGSVTPESCFTNEFLPVGH